MISQTLSLLKNSQNFLSENLKRNPKQNIFFESTENQCADSPDVWFIRLVQYTLKRVLKINPKFYLHPVESVQSQFFMFLVHFHLR